MECIIRVSVIVLLCLLAFPVTGYAESSTSGFAGVNDTQLYYEVQGKGEPLVLIHSGGFDSRMWDDQVEAFSEYKVICFDVRGHGKSKAPTKPYAEQEDLHQLLKFLKIERAHVLGLSLGGRIAIDFAIAHPKMVASLIAVAPGLSGYPYSAQDSLEYIKVVYAIKKEDGSPAGEVWLKSPYNTPAMENSSVAEKLRPIAVENSKSWLINPLFALPIFPPAAQRISEVQAPTLLVRGDQDVPTITKIVDLLAEGIPNAQKVVIPGAGHVVNMEKPEDFNRAVLDFLRHH
jgi:pimeloyl-ACP methyl ester carboxylesterase